MSRNISRLPSPRPDQLDASAVSSTPGSLPLEALPTQSDNGDFNQSSLFSNWGEATGQIGTAPDLLSYSEGRWSLEDNFLRFMDQAGYTTVNDGSEAFPWLASNSME